LIIFLIEYWNVNKVDILVLCYFIISTSCEMIIDIYFSYSMKLKNSHTFVLFSFRAFSEGRSDKIGGHVQILKMGPYEKTRFFKQ